MLVRITIFIFGYLFFTPKSIAQDFSETQGWLCENCVDNISAQEQASVYAPPLTCNTSNGQPVIDPDSDIECTSSPRRVILGNPESKQVFAYIVSREDKSPWLINVQSATLPSEMMKNAVTALEFLEDWTQAIENTNIKINNGARRSATN